MSFFVLSDGFPLHICRCLALMTTFGFFCFCFAAASDDRIATSRIHVEAFVMLMNGVLIVMKEFKIQRKDERVCR
jgi:hypothetical protein